MRSPRNDAAAELFADFAVDRFGGCFGEARFHLRAGGAVGIRARAATRPCAFVTTA